jgi:hypothetical protein
VWRVGSWHGASQAIGAAHSWEKATTQPEPRCRTSDMPSGLKPAPRTALNQKVMQNAPLKWTKFVASVVSP